jgi:XapX domain-containing protein
MIKIAAGLLLAFLVGFGCRALGLPAPAPPILSGALLVFAMTLGYAAVDRVLTQPAQHLRNCGGPTGQAATTEGEPS